MDTPEGRAALEGALAELGLGFADLDQVILTHHHPDHYGLSGWIEAAGAEVWLLDIEEQTGHRFWLEYEPWLQASVEQFRRHGAPLTGLEGMAKGMWLTRSQVHPPQYPKTVADGQTLNIAGSPFRVTWTPGHADGHMALLRDDGVLLAGDHLLERITPNIGLWAYSRPNPLGDYLESLEKVKRLEARMALVGHFGPVIPDIPKRAEELRRHHDERLNELLMLLEGGPQTAWEVSLKLFGGQLSFVQRRFAWAETLAHLEYLRLQGSIRTEEGEGVVRYFL
jgi:glyoxylase-like metal-dependent hydrolase (beta-lactamase superfamily II)